MPPATRILIIRRRYLGDIALLGSVLRNLRLHWPGAHLSVLTEAAYAGVLGLNPDINGALTFPRRLSGWLGFARALRRARFTHVLDFDSDLYGRAIEVTFIDWVREQVKFASIEALKANIGIDIEKVGRSMLLDPARPIAAA